MINTELMKSKIVRVSHYSLLKLDDLTTEILSELDDIINIMKKIQYSVLYVEMYKFIHLRFDRIKDGTIGKLFIDKLSGIHRERFLVE